MVTKQLSTSGVLGGDGGAAGRGGAGGALGDVNCTPQSAQSVPKTQVGVGLQLCALGSQDPSSQTKSNEVLQASVQWNVAGGGVGGGLAGAIGGGGDAGGLGGGDGRELPCSEVVVTLSP
ncbi:MAG: hypothetical protein CMI16_13140 [Opitutaceae bacterium]|nr:hypothetical protein [Opitutaceae bacterium]